MNGKAKNILIVILFLIIIGLVVEICYINGMFKNQKNETKEEKVSEKTEIKKEENLDVNDEIVTNLMYPFNKYESLVIFGNMSYLYEKESLNIDTISNQFKLGIGLIDYTKNNGIDIERFPEDKTISEEDLDKNIKNIFGPNISFNNENIEGCYQWNYDENSKLYTFTPDGCGSSYQSIKTKIISAIKYDDKIEITEKVAGLEAKADNGNMIQILYNNLVDKVEVAQLNSDENFNINNYLDKLSSYKYTFIKNGDNYYFNKIELIK